MSGGSYDYAYLRVKEMADSLNLHNDSPRRVAFAALLKKVGAAMHACEWVDSCDYEPGDEDEAIDACLNFQANRAIADYIEAAAEHLKVIAAALKEQQP